MTYELHNQPISKTIRTDDFVIIYQCLFTKELYNFLNNIYVAYKLCNVVL